MGDDVVIKVNDLHKSFKLPTERSSGLKQAIFNRLKGKKGYKEQRVLRGLNFEVKRGEFLGIVGRNGSGKSTLLKVLSGIYLPQKGKVEVCGSLIPFIELGVGFNPELTGRENVYMNGALMGFSNEEMDKMYDEIVDFAELRDFMDQKLKNYSSGMQVRLAFSIAIRAQGDILVLDEVLAVGDEAFQRKCYGYFAKLRKEKKTVILVTHSMAQVQQFCTRAILIHEGKIVEDGNPLKVSQKYRELNEEESADLKTNEEAKPKYIKVVAKKTLNDEALVLDFNFKALRPLKDPIVAVGIFHDDGRQVYRWASDEKINHPINLNNEYHLQIKLANYFPDGDYSVLFIVKSRDRSEDYGSFDEIVKFRIKPRTTSPEDQFWKMPEEYKLTEAS